MFQIAPFTLNIRFPHRSSVPVDTGKIKQSCALLGLFSLNFSLTLNLGSNGFPYLVKHGSRVVRISKWIEPGSFIGRWNVFTHFLGTCAASQTALEGWPIPNKIPPPAMPGEGGHSIAGWLLELLEAHPYIQGVFIFTLDLALAAERAIPTGQGASTGCYRTWLRLRKFSVECPTI